MLFTVVSIFALFVSFCYFRKFVISSKQCEFEGIKINKFGHVLIHSPKICREVFCKDTVRPKNLGLGNLFDRWLGSCMGCLDTRDQAWSLLKKIFRPLFDSKNKFDVNLILEWDMNLKLLYEKSKLRCRPVGIEEIVNDLPLKFILWLIFGKTFVGHYAKNFNTLQICAKLIMFHTFNNKVAKYKFHRYLPTKINKILIVFKREWEFILGLAKDDVFVRKEGIYDQLFENYLAFRKSNKVEYEMFSQTLAEIVYANQDVAVPSMAWLLVNYSKYYSLLDLSRPMCFIEESARLCPIFLTSMPKIVCCEIKINGEHKINKNSVVLIDFVGLGRSKDFVGMDDLDRFRPGRFDEIRMNEFVGRFGFGGRRCPGSGLANLLFCEVLAYLGKNWSFAAGDSSCHVVDVDRRRPFIMPMVDLWILPSRCVIDSKFIYYNCSPFAKEYNDGFLAISVNRRSVFLKDVDKAHKLVGCMANRQKETVILVADEIAHYNLQAFDHFSKSRAIVEAKNLGDAFIKVFRESIELYGEGRVQLCRWNDLKVPDMTETLMNHVELKKRIMIIANNFLNNRGKGLVNKSYDDKIELVGKYICHEVPVLVCGICYGAKWYRLLYYSGTLGHFEKFAGNKESLHNLILDVIIKPEFETIRNEICRVMKAERCKVAGFIGVDIDNL